MANPPPRKSVSKQIQIDPNDPSKVRDAVLVDAQLLVPLGTGDQALTCRVADGTLITIAYPSVRVWRYYETGSQLPLYIVEFEDPVCEAFCSQAAIDEYNRQIRL